MPQTSLQLACDQLSHVVDAPAFERLRWARTEGPLLARLVEQARGVLEGRDDFELTDEGSTSAIKRFVVKVHSNRIFAIVICLTGGQVNFRPEEIERSRFKLTSHDPISCTFDAADEAWVASALHTLFSRVHMGAQT